ncbi:hypothetical protein TSAR_012122 [Trichomalopsis sarcophagae]|uniref:C2HC/C3H-type domain-containing protein n=1 Tax=Trichomalopsis sarcophagae TaxID=543379 RepID=A0A232F2P4_9HYME|nr:hypothetical protein TSAR_012122 [Trichomalopsis sarcophagae]
MVTRPHYDTPPGVSFNPKSKWMMENLRLMSPPDSSTNLEELIAIARSAKADPIVARKPAHDKLYVLQARFQQKQLQEKEQKLLQLYDQQQQRAHQVAQRGSAGSNGSNGSGKNNIITTTGSVRQLFEERRQQSNVKGIDKSYPLDPLRSKKKPTGQALNVRRNNAQPAKRGTTRTHGTVQAANNNRAAAVSRESYASSRSSSNSYKDSSIQRESFTRESYASSRGDYDEPSESSRQQLNGHAKHYEINIDEVIDNEAMERNRLLAKFHQVDVDKRRHFDIESDDIPGDENYFGSRRSSLDPPRNTAAALKSNNNARKSNALTAATVAPVTAAVAAAVNATKKPTIPTGARQSTVMKTTKSASLKIRKKAPLSRKTVLEGRPRSTSLTKINPAKDSTRKQEDAMSKSVGSWDREMDWNTLKSTSLIFEMIRKASKLDQIGGDSDKIGKVRKMVTKIENSIPSTSNANAEADGNTEPAEKSSTEADTNNQQQQQQPSTSAITDSDLCKSDAAREAIEVSATSREILLRNIQSEDQGDGLLQREEINLLSIRGKRESSVEQPSEYQEIVVANQTIEKRAENRPKSVRRASFELKRIMFEQIQGRESFQRYDSVESALRHFDSIVGSEPVPTRETDNSQMDRSTFRLCSKDAIKKNSETRRGFERHTSAWSIRTLKDSAYRHVKTPVAAKRAFTRRGKKLLEARDSIELARVPVKMKLPACRRKILLVSNSRPAENDDTAPVKSQSFRSREGRVARLKSLFSREQTPKNHDFSPSTTRNSISEYKAKKNVAPYPSSKSPDNLSEKSRASGSLKFLGRLNGSNGELENGFSTAARKSNVSAVDGLVDDNDEKQSGYVAVAPRTTSSLSSNSSVGTNRSHGSTASRPTGKPKAAPPTPAASDSLSTCKICNRRFATDRIGLHEQICAKTSQKKRKQFDAVTHRVKGTELESFVQKPGKKQGKAAAKPAAASVEPSKSNWRRKHEDFINAIRSAKQMQAHLASGGKLSDLPPPPPSDTSDYIQCPHCSRKFNQGAAERHIPKCANMQHNKPNPRAPPRSRR